MGWYGNQHVRIGRDELYEKVWTEPILRLAARYGVSDVALAKLCKRLNVPRPPRGYWAKLEYGRAVRKAKLPELGKGVADIGYLPKREPKQEEDDRTPITKAHAAVIRATRIQVPEGFSDPDPVVGRIEEAFRCAKVNKRGFLYSRRKNSDWIRVSEASYDRTLRILDALSKACRFFGFDVTLGAGVQVGTPLGTVEFRIEEPIEPVEREPTAWESRTDSRRLSYEGEVFAPRKYYRHVPSGRLSLWITSPSPASERRTWSDTKKSPLEKQLNTVLVGLIRFAEGRQLKLEQLELERLEREERHRQWEEAERRRVIEAQRRSELWRLIEEWRKSETVRQFARAVSESDMNPPSGFNLERSEWLLWMESYANRIDPLKCS